VLGEEISLLCCFLVARSLTARCALARLAKQGCTGFGTKDCAGSAEGDWFGRGRAAAPIL